MNIKKYTTNGINQNELAMASISHYCANEIHNIDAVKYFPVSENNPAAYFITPRCCFISGHNQPERLSEKTSKDDAIV